MKLKLSKETVRQMAVKTSLRTGAHFRSQTADSLDGACYDTGGGIASAGSGGGGQCGSNWRNNIVDPVPFKNIGANGAAVP